MFVCSRYIANERSDSHHCYQSNNIFFLLFPFFVVKVLSKLATPALGKKRVGGSSRWILNCFLLTSYWSLEFDFHTEKIYSLSSNTVCLCVFV
jgi:hypothetical protein